MPSFGKAKKRGDPNRAIFPNFEINAAKNRAFRPFLEQKQVFLQILVLSDACTLSNNFILCYGAFGEKEEAACFLQAASSFSSNRNYYSVV